MKLFKRLLSNNQNDATAAPESPFEGPASQMTDGQEDSRLAEFGVQTQTRRELLRVLTRDTMRFCGVPDGWVECQVLVVNTRQGQTHLHCRLVIRHWDEMLLHYAVAMEQRLLREVERFEPGASEWLHSVTWQFRAENYPDTGLPRQGTWVGMPAVNMLDTEGGPGSDAEPAYPKAAPSLPEPQTDDDVASDLALLLAVRDSALADLRAEEEPVRDFMPTQPGMH